MGLAQPAMRERDRVPDLAKFFHVGTLSRHVRGAEGLRAILADYFRVPVRIEEFVGHWMYLDPRERTRLRREGATLGSGAVLGERVWDRQHKFRVHLGPLTLAQYESFLPAWRQRGEGTSLGGRLLPQLVDWIRFYQCFELEWDVQLSLGAGEVPRFRLGQSGLLGWTTWLGRRASSSDAGDLCLDAETFVKRDRVA
jgi:type VI secretion system protein ImpH